MRKLLSLLMFRANSKSDVIDVFCYDTNAIVNVSENFHLEEI